MQLARALATFLFLPLGLTAALPVAEAHGRIHCNDATLAIGSIFVSIAYIIGRATGAYFSNKRDGIPSLAGYLEGALGAEGEAFDSIDDMTHTAQARDDSTDGPIETASVRNWLYNGVLVNFDIHDFGDGNGHILLPTDGVGQNATLTKRTSGRAPGFKVSYTTWMESKLTHAHRVDMANALASDWASRANGNDRLSNYIGLWKTDHSANFYFRIIPESSNFGMNYESVDVCGGMAGLL
ncbi:hypothetical protein BBP40_011324 [Aspergillus hancockii]|nr:hypothetical protein BBP40_011324 [Aspergillus hancockii]